MTYSAEELERQFKRVGAIRENVKEFKDDAGYWTGGRCNWGASHNLHEDCQTLANAFNKIDSLGEIKKELQNCSSKEEYDAKKENFIRKAEEAETGLQIKTRKSSSMFGICIVWEHVDTSNYVESKAKLCREEIKKIKLELKSSSYRWVQEIKQLKLEETQIRQKMKENERKAQSEKDPTQKALLLQMIEDDGKKLKKNLEKQKELSKKFNFDPGKRVDDLIKSMKEAIEGNRANNSGSNFSRRNKKDEEDDDQNNNGGNNSNNSTTNPNSSENKGSDWFQNNQSLIIFGAIAILLFFYFYTHQEEEPNYYDF